MFKKYILIVSSLLMSEPNNADISKIDSSATFWLDAHWSQGLSDKNHLDVPLIEECVIIDQEYKSDTAIVVIDDVRMFETNINEDWSYVTIDAVKSSFKNFDILISEEVEDRLVLLISRKK